ncbi:hypothetical protein [Pseudoalteromonas aurantia]|uniref:hypothetical protein n=1 Tax=Pseudoalteromonas aurantia TaxID=43654 RepID=UPI0014862353|nr:hypothetical protein [Pseudoalteromonas aurantia]
MRKLSKNELSKVVGRGISSPDLPKKQNTVQPADETTLKKLHSMHSMGSELLMTFVV